MGERSECDAERVHLVWTRTRLSQKGNHLSIKLRHLVSTLVVAMALIAMSGVAVGAQDATPESSSSFPVEITFVNGLTALSAVDVYINGDEEGQRVIEGLKYGETSQAFEGTAPGTVVVVKQNVNFGVDRYLYSTLVPTAAGQSYVVVISDFILIPVQIDLSAVSGSGARTVAAQAASEAPAVDIYAAPTGAEFAIGNLIPFVTDLRYGTTTAGTAVEAGTYDVTLTQTGTDTVVLQQAGVTVDAGQSYVFVLIGKPGSSDQPLTLVTVAQPLAS